MVSEIPGTAERTIRQWAAAVAARDIEAIMACYGDPLIVFDVVGPLRRQGKATYRKAWEDEFFRGTAEPEDSCCATFPSTRTTTLLSPLGCSTAPGR